MTSDIEFCDKIEEEGKKEGLPEEMRGILKQYLFKARIMNDKVPSLQLIAKALLSISVTELVLLIVIDRKQFGGVERINTKGLRYEILKRQNWVCNNCGTRLKYNINSNWDGEVAHIDHIHPFSQAYSYINGADNINEIINLQALCPKCNREKHTRKQ